MPLLRPLPAIAVFALAALPSCAHPSQAPLIAAWLSQETYRTGSVVSKDGVRIGYVAIGRGPGVVLVQGAMGTAYNYDQLARTLANDFTVYVPDRRGRGMSPHAYGPDYSVQKDVEDLESLLRQTGVHCIFGLSSGAIITIEAARQLPAVHKAVLYEPPFLVDGVPTDLIARFNDDVSGGRLAAAFVTAMEIVKLAPPAFYTAPHWIRDIVVRSELRKADKNPGRYALMRELLPAMRFDFAIVSEMSGRLASMKDVRADVLLLGGTKSPSYLKKALDALEGTLPHVHRIEFQGLDHSAAWNIDRGGSPQIVAAHVRNFFREVMNGAENRD